MLLDLKQLIKTYKLKITGIIHCGANTGQEVPLYNELGFCPIALIEPCTDAFTELYKKYTGYHILFNVAVSDYDGETEMFVSYDNEGQSNSLLQPSLHKTYYPDINFEAKETVTVRKLDSLLLPRKEFNFLVMDIQGGELNALKGATETLNYISYIYAEVSRESLYDNNPMVEDIDNYLQDFSRVKTKWLRKGYGDALYIRKTLL